MKKTFCTLLAIIILGGIIMTSCSGNAGPELSSVPEDSGISEPDESSVPEDKKNIALGCPYFYEYGATVKGDKFVTALTDGDVTGFVTLSPSLDKNGKGYYIEANDWNGNVQKLAVDNTTAAVSVDFGFMAQTERFEITLEDYTYEKCKVFYSTDGYNFSFYAGETGTYENGVLASELSVYAKAVMFVFPFSPEHELKISEIRIEGTREHSRELLSLGASYTWEGKERVQYPDDGTKLTDGVTAADADKDAVASRLSSERDERTGKAGTIINMDLGSVKHVSEVSFGAYNTVSIDPPARVEVRVSADGENWVDLGQSFLRTSVSERGGASYKYLVTRNHTVDARYVRIYTFHTTMFLTDEIYVYGSSSAVAEPDYGFIDRKNQLSNSNVASFNDASLNGEKSTLLTDLTYTEGVSTKAGENTLKIMVGEREPLCGAALTVKGKAEITDISVVCGANDAGDVKVYPCSEGGKTTYYIFFDTAKGTYITVRFNTPKAATLLEAAAYSGQPQLPLVRGGFFQLSTAGDNGFYSAGNDAYSWYLQLKAMKDLGMEYVVVQYSTHYNAKTTLINGKHITGAGYKYNSNYGVPDVCGAILDAADKLGMKVWLGTIHDSDFNSPIANKETYKKIVADSEYIIRDIAEMYSSHPSFGGYYLSDEECDQWLNMNGGVEAARIVYGGQSKLIRELVPEAQIMIAPAIWRSGRPETGADNLYKAIRAENKGEKPIVDIVAAQDCLGRLSTLWVDSGTYGSYDEYCAEWAKAVRRAGAEFWHDAEVFEVTGTPKRYSELVKSLGIEAKHSGSVIVFDIPHYFTQFPTAAYDNVRQYYMRLIMRDYAEYYSSFAALDRVGEDAAKPKVKTDDGKVIEDTSALADAKVYDKTFNEGVITLSSPPADTASAQLRPFRLGNNKAKPEFAYYADDEAFWVIINTHDETDDHKNGTWWTGEDDLVQIWMVTTGETASVATDNDHGVRFWIHRTAKGWEKGGTAGPAIMVDLFEYTYNDGVFVIKMPWKALGINKPVPQSGQAMGIVIQYIDGSDQSWATSQGSKGQAVDTAALYSY